MNDMNIHCEGTVKNWDAEKGYGFISTKIGNFYTHISCTKGRIELRPGQKVKFNIELSEKGQIAKNVEVV